MFVLGKVLSTAAVLLCILCLAAPLKKNRGRTENKRTSDTAEAACVIWLAAACYRAYAWDYGRQESGDDQWQVGMDGIACSASCGLPEKPDEKICLDVSAQIFICCFCSRNRISYCVCSDILKLQFLFPPCKSF